MTAGRVLVAIDRRFAAALLAASLEEAGFDVDWTPRLEAAARLAREREYQAVLVELDPSITSLAGIDELARELTATPLIAIARSAESIVPASIEFVVTKPFTGGELIATLRAALATAPPAEARVLALHPRPAQQGHTEAAAITASPKRAT